MEYDYFEGRPHDAVLEHRRRINLQIHERFRLRDLNNPLSMSVTEFVKIYRMPQDAVVRLCNIIHPYMQRHTSPQQTPLIRKVLATLSFLGSGIYQRPLGRILECSISQTSASRFIREVITALNHPDLLSQFIKFPLTHEERVPIILRNERMGMPRVLGFIDGFLVRLNNLPHDNERQAYFTRKGWTGLNNQIICDADLNILNIDARFPGSCNDQMVWNASSARQVVEDAYWQDRCWLLGDSGYCTAPWLHTPLPHAPEGSPEYYYTQLHCSCRNCVERCIGLLKARWRVLCIDRAINYGDAEYAGYMVNACSLLHNYCNRFGVAHPPLFLDADYVHGAHDDIDDEGIRQLGIAERNNLVDYVYQHRQNRFHVEI